MLVPTKSIPDATKERTKYPKTASNTVAQHRATAQFKQYSLGNGSTGCTLTHSQSFSSASKKAWLALTPSRGSPVKKKERKSDEGTENHFPH